MNPSIPRAIAFRKFPNPAMESDRPYSIGLGHYRRGMAFTTQGHLEQAGQELEKLRAIAATSGLQQITPWQTPASTQLLAVAVEMLASKLALAQGNAIAAQNHLKTASSLISEDDWVPDFHLPV